MGSQDQHLYHYVGGEKDDTKRIRRMKAFAIKALPFRYLEILAS
jgi:hypothetical protein